MPAPAAGGSSRIVQDEFEPDSRDNPLSCEIGVDEEAQVINRTIHEGDEDFFILVPDRAGRITFETTGGMDTYMELYNYATGEELAGNDDGGSGGNARIKRNLQAGARYLVKVRGYSGNTGSYGFKAYFSGDGASAADEYEPNDEPFQAKSINIGTAQQHTFHDTDDIDWVRFLITQPGRYTIRTMGVRSNHLDTCIALFDASNNLIGEDDDGGINLDSRLSLHLQSGMYFLKVWCLDDDPGELYTIIIEAE